MKRPLIGSQVIRSNDSLQRIAVVLNVTTEENVLRYEDGTEVWDKDLPFLYVGFSDPANWAPSVKFPRPANKEEMDRMVRSIKQNGLLDPIAVHGAVLLDGRNRLMACNLAGVDPIFFEVETEDPVGWARAKNIDRRHLSMDDIKQAIRDEMDYIKEIAADAKKRLSPVERALESTNNNLGPNGPQSERTRDQVAKQFGVSGRTVERVFAEQKASTELQDKAPELADKVKAGELTLKDARIEAGLDDKAVDLGEQQTASVTFLLKHLKAFRIFAKENDIAWEHN